MAKKLMVVLGCDCDPDRPRYGGLGYDDRSAPLKWRGVEEGIPRLIERLRKIEDATGLKVKVTFFLRSDTQVDEIHGTPAWPALEYADMWRSVEEEGHELAWHPHVWRWSDEWNCWFQETKDSGWINKCLRVGHAGISEALGKEPTSCHMGWTFQNNATMNVLSELGVGIDFSACPGVYSEGGPSEAGTRFDNMIDWLDTPRAHYHPSTADYRRPAQPGETELDIVECPKFTSKSAALKRAKGLVARAGGGSASMRATAAFVQITAAPIIYNRVIKERLGSKDAEPFFATYFHPDELLPDRPRSARGLLYSPANLEKNLLAIAGRSAKSGREVDFVTGSEALRHIQEVDGGLKD
jgi:peptidoglycan/xylan/chitin deacetylase (PgdA/CDA1 family)